MISEENKLILFLISLVCMNDISYDMKPYFKTYESKNNLEDLFLSTYWCFKILT